MNVRQELDQVRAMYESKDTRFLMSCLKNMGVDPDDMDRAEVLDTLMAMEEYAAFH